ncbi:NHLP-related RiPP peptide [Xanthomonas oryzae]
MHPRHSVDKTMTDSADSAHLPFDVSTAARLLELLSDDDDFRDCLQCNPAQALAQIGHARDGVAHLHIAQYVDVLRLLKANA